ncbi:superoxide dismutase [Cu-Zn] [Anastrepha ludens]|uniref:superoxide dismutase [Cu-Zn] n=1 Tax=Anastrepha ludens TaxID=28586 RepID=UPI0023B18360|nr:superoxide dismutase [Cu-Zn] [Anastrepha ludens]
MAHIIRLLWHIFLLFTICVNPFAVASNQATEIRARPTINNSYSNKAAAEVVKVVSGTQVKRFERMTVPLGGELIHHPLYFGYNYVSVVTHWQASAKISIEGESAVSGMITFQQMPYNSDLKVTINITGLAPGKHALHIHTYGDISEGCKSTGGQFPNNFIGNIETKEDGSISAAFRSVYLNLFGFNGIIGRSIVVHEKPIDLNTALNAEVFSSSLQALPDPLAYQNEENSVGPAIACGVISITSTTSATKTPTTTPTTPPQM